MGFLMLVLKQWAAFRYWSGRKVTSHNLHFCPENHKAQFLSRINFLIQHKVLNLVFSCICENEVRQLCAHSFFSPREWCMSYIFSAIGVSFQTLSAWWLYESPVSFSVWSCLSGPSGDDVLPLAVEVERRSCLLLASLCIFINVLLIFVQSLFPFLPATLQAKWALGLSLLSKLQAVAC